MLVVFIVCVCVYSHTIHFFSLLENSVEGGIGVGGLDQNGRIYSHMIHHPFPLSHCTHTHTIKTTNTYTPFHAVSNIKSTLMCKQSYSHKFKTTRKEEKYLHNKKKHKINAFFLSNSNKRTGSGDIPKCSHWI